MQVALLNGLLSHADGLVKSAITSLQEVQNEDGEYAFFRNCISLVYQRIV